MRFRHPHLSFGLLFSCFKSALPREYSGKTDRISLSKIGKVKVVVCFMSYINIYFSMRGKGGQVDCRISLEGFHT
jgi:hypothetical protein